MTRHIFFSGKGGVGKTTMACATAIRHALEGKKTLIVSTDPASNLSDVFEQEIWHKITPIDFEPPHPNPLPQGERELYNPPPLTGGGEGEGVKKGFLYAMEIDPDEATREYKEKIIAPYRQIMPEDVIASIDEQLSSPCTTEMASFDRFIDFMEGDEYDVVVFDTAPTGHTIRLLELPVDYAKQTEMMVSAYEAKTAKEAAENRFRKIIDTLKDKNRTTFCIVLYPGSTPIMESYRAMLDLKAAGINTQMVVANMILPDEVCKNDFFKNRRGMQMRYLTEIHKKFNLPVLQFPLMQKEIKGIKALERALTYIG